MARREQRALKTGYSKAFEVGPADREPPDPALWRLIPPAADTAQALVVDFQEPLDHALATRLIRVTDDANTAVSGELRLEDRERRWLFVPARNWNPGDYSVVVWTTIEDLAGNNIGKPFEVSMEDDAPRFANTPVKVGFRVK